MALLRPEISEHMQSIVAMALASIAAKNGMDLVSCSSTMGYQNFIIANDVQVM